MRYEGIWEVLADLVTELRKKGEMIPANVMNELRSAKTMIHVLRADPSHVENVPRIETYLENVEFHLVSLAQKKFGSKFVEQWMKKLGKAQQSICEEEEENVVSRFVPGLPRSKSWVRVQVSEGTPQGDIENLAEDNGLSHRQQKNGYVLVYGDSESLKSFVGRLRSQQSSSKRRKSKSKPV
ncbi:MAG: DUF2096 family protein [Candidatus Bathyarchaeota archaeon]|nr:MAG: DUF2096 family protein [Candidatus Bathyarchaeota archaeon]